MWYYARVRAASRLVSMLGLLEKYVTIYETVRAAFLPDRRLCSNKSALPAAEQGLFSRTRSSKMNRLHLLFALPVLLATATFAQTTFGSITGTVTDASGMPIPRAEILGKEANSG